MTFPNEASEFVYTRTYSRWIEEQGRRETWEETVDRYVEFIKAERGELIPPKVIRKIKDKILNFEVMPSMRALWAAGPALKKENLTGYNCSFLSISSITSFSEIFYLLMCGTGTGYSVESKYTEQLPVVPQITIDQKEAVMVGDSREGWADSVKILLTALYSGKDIDFDYTNVRPKGSRLMTMGGRSSGPAPLITLHNFIRETLSKAQGRKLSTLECSDIANQIADSVVVGGVRRSAQISLSELNDEEMRNAKNWPFPPRRFMSNNSAVYYDKPSAVEFLKEWSALASSGTGERGIVNLGSLQKKSNGRRDFSKVAGFNPCSEIALRDKELCVSYDTKLITRNGIVQIGEAVDKSIEIWNGKQWSKVVPKKTRTNEELFRVRFSDGSYLDCTGDHKFSVKNRFQKNFKQLKTLELVNSKYALQCEPYEINSDLGKHFENAYTLGFAVGDGCVYKDEVYVDLYGTKDTQCPVMGTRYKPYLSKGYNVTRTRVNSKEFVDGDFVRSLKTNPQEINSLFSWDKKSVLNFMAGLADADGSNTGTGGIRIYISNEERARLFQLLLSKNGMKSSVNLCQKKGSVTNKGIRKDDLWYLQITECQNLPTTRLNVSKGHRPKYKGQFQTIRSVTKLEGLHDTFCFEEKERHMAVFNNVLTYQCNLSEVVLRKEDDLDSLLDKVETATWIGAIQSTFTEFPYMSKEWKDNCDEERLLGVSITGIMDNPDVMTPDILKALKQKAIKVAKHASSKLGINVATAITAVKPSGTVSQLCDSASGIHPRYAQYYIRRYRISSTDPLFKLIRDQGIDVSPENGQETLPTDQVSTWVIEFPIKAPKGCITRNDLTALEQLEWYKKVQTSWCEHNTSMTIYVKDSEWFEVGNWVYKNWDIINGVSFLPADGGKYQQAPYEEVTKEQYEKLAKRHKSIDYSQLSKYEKEDTTEGAKMYACVGDRCEIT